MAKSNITTTKNYRMFVISGENRPLNIKKRKRLRDSMKEYGFLRSYPLSCFRSNGKLHVKDGQHRLAIAEELGLPVHYCVDDVDYDIAKVNCTQEKWTVRDFAMRFATAGNKHYQEGLDFTDRHNLPIGIAFSLLAGTVNWSNIREAFVSGSFKIVDRSYADGVASIYNALTVLSKDLRNARVLEACMCVCRVKKFDANRLISGAKRRREKLVSYSTKDACLEMLEEVYNFGRKELFPLKIEAIQSMRDRNVKSKNGKPSDNGN